MLERVPKSENKDTKPTSSFGRWLGKHWSKSPESPEKIRISEPRPLTPPYLPLRSSRSSFELTTTSRRGSRILPELEEPKLLPKTPRVQRQNLGTNHEALGSHPVPYPRRGALMPTWLDRMEERVPAQHILLKPVEEDNKHKITTHQEAEQNLPQPESLAANGNSRQIPADVKAERRKGRIFLGDELSRSFYEFPDPEVFVGEDEDSEKWEDAGFDDTDTGNKGTIPSIIVTAPDEDMATSDSRLLNVGDSYKIICHRQSKELNDLRSRERILLPLAVRVAEAEGIDLNDVYALEDSLKNIIADRDLLLDVYPLAHILAEDQKLDIENLKVFPHVLKKVLADRDNARRVADHHKTIRHRLEKRGT